MANNPYVNKVVYGNNTVMDISDTTAEEADVASGAVFYKASGERSVGTGSTSGDVSEDLLKDTVGWVGKNLLNCTTTVASTLANGITWTVFRNADNVIEKVVANGTATNDNAYFNLLNPAWTPIEDTLFEADTYYTVSWGRVADNTVWMGRFANRFDDDQHNNVEILDNGTSEKTFKTRADATQVYASLQIRNGATVNNLVFYPMLRKASVTDDTYEPYHPSVEEELEKKTISLTKAEYDALPSTDKNDPDKVYYVTDYDPDDDSTVVQVPSFYVELSVAPTAQTPIVVPDGTLSKPFRLILRNVGSSNITIGAGSSAVFMKEQTSATVKSIYTTYRVSSYSYKNGSASVRIYPASSTSQTYPSIADLTYDPKVEKLIFEYTPIYDYSDFLGVKEAGSGVDSSTGRILYTSKNESLMILTHEYNASTGVYRGQHAYFVFTPNVDNPVPQSIAMGASSNTGISITFANEDESTGKITIKASASTYYVGFTAYRVWI